MTKLVVDAPSVEEAMDKACGKLGVPRERVRFRVLREPRAGWFGLFGRRDALVEAERVPDPLEETAEFLQILVRQMGWEAEVEMGPDPDGGEEKWLILTGEQLGGLIGKGGQTLDAIETLAQAVFWNKGGRSRLVVEAGGYRMKKRERMAALVERLCREVLRTGREKALPPMPSQERKWVHQWVKKYPGLSTSSMGEEPHRRVMIRRAP